MNLIDKYLGEEREGKYFKRGETIVFKAPNGYTMQGTVVSGDIMGKLKVAVINSKGKKEEILVPTNKATKFDAKKLKKNMKSGSAAMFHYDTMYN